MGRFGYGKQLRLLSARDYGPVFDKAEAKISRPVFLILARYTGRQNPRLGLVISKKNARRAVDRNRIKRLVRESFRQQQHELPNWDIVFLARRGIAQQNHELFSSELDKAWHTLSKRANQAPPEST